MKYVEALDLIEKNGGRALGMPTKGQHHMSVGGVTIKAYIWERLLELDELEESGDGGNNVYVLLTDKGRQCLEPKCRVEGCDRDKTVRGWCKMHYERWRKNGDPTVRRRPSNAEFQAMHHMEAVDDGFWAQVYRCQNERLWV